MEWTVVSVLAVIAGLIVTVARPLAKNTKAMTRLSERINHLVFRLEREENALNAFKSKAAEKHEKLFEKLGEQEGMLINHEGRICALEKRGEQNEKMV